MSKLNQAIHEIHTLDQMANQDQWVNRIHPLVKLCLTIVYIIVVVSFSKYALSGLLSMAIYPIIVFSMGEISWKDALYRLRVVLPVVCVVGIFNPFFDCAIVTYVTLPRYHGGASIAELLEAGMHTDLNLGIIAISGGVLSMLSLMVKGILTVLASYILIATTSIEKLCHAMRIIHIPKMMVTQLLLIYRYITVLLSEAKRITQAYSLRAPGQKGVNFKVWGSLVGQLLLRSMDRADDIYESMCLRGYSGEFYFGEKIRWSVKDMLFLVGWIVIFGVLRVFPMFHIIGSLFV